MVCVVRDMTIVNKDQSLSIKDLNQGSSFIKFVWICFPGYNLELK